MEGSKTQILIADDSEYWITKYKKWLGEVILAHNLGNNIDINFFTASNGQEAKDIIEEQKNIKIVISDVCMNPNCSRGTAGPDDSSKPFGGIWLMKRILEIKKKGTRDIQCLLISDKDIKRYCVGFLGEAIDVSDYFIEKISDMKEFGNEVQGRTYEAFIKMYNISRLSDEEFYMEFISDKMKQIKELATKAAQTSANMLILGETGTGKEALAQFIVSMGNRANRKLVVVNCAAVPDTLLESELFGHTKGAFTGALTPRTGLFKEANGGTILLDEIGDMPLLLQAKLLRVMEKGRIRPVGSDKEEPIDIRIMAATHQDLEKRTVEEKFREDLYYRLNVLPITLPPIRDRIEDIPLIIDYYLERINKKYNKTQKLSADIRNLMKEYEWPGNIREIKNLIERAVASDDEKCIDKEINRKRALSRNVSSSKSKGNDRIKTIKIADELNYDEQRWQFVNTLFNFLTDEGKPRSDRKLYLKVKEMESNTLEYKLLEYRGNGIFVYSEPRSTTLTPDTAKGGRKYGSLTLNTILDEIGKTFPTYFNNLNIAELIKAIVHMIMKKNNAIKLTDIPGILFDLIDQAHHDTLYQALNKMDSINDCEIPFWFGKKD